MPWKATSAVLGIYENTECATSPSIAFMMVLVANINRNIILADMEAYAGNVRKGGKLIFSGFYVDDIPLIRSRAEELGLTFEDFTENLNWASTLFIKQ